MPEKKAYHLLENAIVVLWKDQLGKVYKIEIRHKDFSAYLEPPMDNDSQCLKN